MSGAMNSGLSDVGPVEESTSERPPMDMPPFREALRFWLKLGWISFGGTAAHIAIMHDELVEKKRWISNRSFLHALSHCMILPGPEAQQLAIYIGWKLHGRRGGIVAGTLFVLPSMLVLLGLSVIYVRFGSLPWIAAMFHGLKPAVLALVVLALERVGRRALRNGVQCTVAAAAFVAMFFFQVSLPLIMLGAVAIGLVLGSVRPGLFHGPVEAESEEDESGYLIHSGAATVHSGLGMSGSSSLFRSGAKVVAVALLLWAVPMAGLFCFARDFHFWNGVVLFFTRTAFVTVGGSYTVIPYVAQVAVWKLHWLSQAQMTDGFALAETTPGPLIIVVAFVGFMAAQNHFHGSLWMGTLGLLVTTFYTFLPCFLFVFAGAPLVERSHGNRRVEAVMGLITAVVVGAILDLAFFLGRGVLFPPRAGLPRPDLLSVGWIVISLVLLRGKRVSVVALIGMSIGFGLLRFLFGR